MLNSFYKDLTSENRKFAIGRIALKTDTPEEIVKKVLESNNPLMDIQENRVVVNRNAFQRLVREMYKEMY